MKWTLVLIVSLLFLNLNAASAANFDYRPMARPAGIFACSDKIKAKLKNNGILNIAVAFGYSDLTDEHFDLVTDSFTLSLIDHNLTNRCAYEHQGFCEFKLVEGNDHQVHHYTRNLITNDITNGITNDGESLTVNLYTINSSYSVWNSDNKTKFKDLQGIQTQTAREFYSWAQQNADMVFYEGHSRDGGGPDFSPPRPTRSGSVDYSWYHANKPGLKFLLSSLDTAREKPSVFGLFSCASRVHFLKSLKQHTPDSKLLLSTKVVESGNTKLALLRTLESVLNFECDSDLKARLSGTSFVVN